MPASRRPVATSNTAGGPEDGIYYIRNAKQHNEVILLRNEVRCDLVGSFTEPSTGRKWLIKRYQDTTKYSIKYPEYSLYAACDHQPAGNGNETVFTSARMFQWLLQPVPNRENCFLIKHVEDNVYWGLSSCLDGTPVVLRPAPSDPGNQWEFKPAVSPEGPSGDRDPNAAGLTVRRNDRTEERPPDGGSAADGSPGQAHHDSRPEARDADGLDVVPPEEELDINDGTKDELLKKLPNIFRLLDLYQESGFGRVAEKVLVDQNSLRRLLNQLSPSSYESISKIHFEILDKSTIEPVGVYGCESEIIKFLQGVGCLSDESAALLASFIGSPEGLRSGLYLALPERDASQGSPTYRAYIIYWPQVTTWMDDATLSTENNRITFMHYLTKLADQTIALVSVEQAEAKAWSSGVDLDDPASEVGDDDELAGYEHVVDWVDESEENVIVNPGFTVRVKSKHLPKNARTEDVRFVSGEQKAGLLVSIAEPSRMEHKTFQNEVTNQGPLTRYLIYPLELTEHDNRLCQANKAYVPTPKLETRQKFEFTLSKNRNIEFLQLVRDKCLAVISEHGKSHIYIEDNLSLDQSIKKRWGKVALDHDSLGGPRCLFAFDQATRLLAIVHGEKELKLSVYIFDEFFSGLRSRGSPIPFGAWYEAGARIDILAHHSTIPISAPVVDAFSAPDGSCLFVTVANRRAQQQTDKLLAFHWASFGLNQNGIHVIDLASSSAARVITRLEGRGRNQVLTFSGATRSVSSVAVQVKQESIEYPYSSDREGIQATAAETFGNRLIDCHLEVWTRFPVVPAISRCTLSPVKRQPRKLVFQSSVPLTELGDYFARMISSFERTTRKPMDGTLSSISVSASTNGAASLSTSISEFLFGSFIVELLCLVPLHLAITRDNSFIPLKDGAWDPAYERTLLGADVPAIIGALSLGWYESLLQSYMATKASRLVRVVSSMGEQRVGKSYCLNHFADTSFAGSAMRTTEGVWLSCTPTESYLLVSLDFEGVHSIERSAQEDAFLVLFSTAISNLVLFRNNFALSRDIAGLFTSFQSSAMVLDSNANKGLFNSTLAIIIKDVINSDAKDIITEFSLKFRQTVEKEQDQNFISRLHRNRIQIIPWPVINSPGFYTSFRQLRQRLDRERFTHGTADAFLHNLKTLMAKIKVQDWGSF